MTERAMKRGAAAAAGTRIISVDGQPVNAPAKAQAKRSIRKIPRGSPAPTPVTYELPAVTKAPAKVTSVQPAVSAIAMHTLRALVGAPNVSAEQEELDARNATQRLRAAAEKAEQAAKGLTDQPAAATPTVLHRPSHGPAVTTYDHAGGGRITGPAPSDQERVYNWVWAAFNAKGRQLSVTLLPGEIARDLGLSADQVRSHIAALERLGRIVRDGGSPGLPRFAPVVPGGAR